MILYQQHFTHTKNPMAGLLPAWLALFGTVQLDGSLACCSWTISEYAVNSPRQGQQFEAI